MRTDAHTCIKLPIISGLLTIVSTPETVGVCGGDQPSNLKNAVNTYFELYCPLSQLDFPENRYFATFPGILRLVVAHIGPEICFTI